MNPDLPDARISGVSMHLPVEKVLGDHKHPVIQAYIVRLNNGRATGARAAQLLKDESSSVYSDAFGR